MANDQSRQQLQIPSDRKQITIRTYLPFNWQPINADDRLFLEINSSFQKGPVKEISFRMKISTGNR